MVFLQRADLEIVIDAPNLACTIFGRLEFRRRFLYANLLEGVFIEPPGTLMVVLLHFQAKDGVVFVISLILLEGDPMSVRHFHRQVVRSAQRNTITLPHFFHTGLSTKAVQQRTDLPGLAKGIVYNQDVLGIVTKVRRYHVPNLEANRQGAHHHHHGHDADEVFVSWGEETHKKFTKAEIEGCLKSLEDAEK